MSTFTFKGNLDPSDLNVWLNVGKSRIRNKTTLNLNDAMLNHFWVDLEIQFQ